MKLTGGERQRANVGCNFEVISLEVVLPKKVPNHVIEFGWNDLTIFVPDSLSLPIKSDRIQAFDMYRSERS